MASVSTSRPKANQHNLMTPLHTWVYDQGHTTLDVTSPNLTGSHQSLPSLLPNDGGNVSLQRWSKLEHDEVRQLWPGDLLAYISRWIRVQAPSNIKLDDHVCGIIAVM